MSEKGVLKMLEKFYYDYEADRVVSIGELATEYAELVESNGTEQSSFEDYIKACHWRNNGSLSDILNYYEVNILCMGMNDAEPMDILRWFCEEYAKYGGITNEQKREIVTEIVNRIK